jgi:hypothetical protein
MLDYLRYEDLVVGDNFGPIEQVLTKKLIAKYCADFEDPNPLYREASPLGPPLAPITYDTGRLGADLLGTKFDISRTVVTKTAQRNLRPVVVGQTVTTTGSVDGKYVKRGYEYVVVSFTSCDESGQPFRTGVDHLAISLEKRAEL